MIRPQSSRLSAFTLIELLTVIAVIGILAVILIPTVSGVREQAQRTAAASKLRKIHTAYTVYTTDGPRARSIDATDIYDWARRLAQEADFNDPQMYLLAEDPLIEFEENLPVVVATPPASGGGDWTVHPAFAGFPLSFAVANRLSSQAPAATPLAWTRGLTAAGTWGEDGVYGPRGGHVLRVDGSVEFYEDLGEDGGQLLDYRTKQPTGDLGDALGPDAHGLDHEGRVF
ncbi:MAG: type II secretion system protein [Opitutales bacterium]